MMNPFLNQNPMGNMPQFMQQFQQFRQSFRGDPKQEIQRMLQSGQITQEQVNRAQQMAQQISGFLPR